MADPRTDRDDLAEDYNACGVRLHPPIPTGGSAALNVWCVLPANHGGAHAASVVWEYPGGGLGDRIAQAPPDVVLGRPGGAGRETAAREGNAPAVSGGVGPGDSHPAESDEFTAPTPAGWKERALVSGDLPDPLAAAAGATAPDERRHRE